MSNRYIHIKIKNHRGATEMIFKPILYTELSEKALYLLKAIGGKK